jgi:hypothetical protein
MPDPTFTEGQRVYHRQRRQFGTYIQQDWHRDESIVAFPDDDYCRVTTAQLVPADEAEETA